MNIKYLTALLAAAALSLGLVTSCATPEGGEAEVEPDAGVVEPGAGDGAVEPGVQDDTVEPEPAE